MIKKFLISKKSVVIIVFLSLAVFGFIFFLFNLNFDAFLLGAAIILFVFIIYMVISFTDYKKEKDKDKEIDTLKNKLKELNTEQSEFYRDLESYFIIWIHQIKTPITAAKLVANNKNDRETEVLLNEIENYTNLAMSYLKLHEPESDLNFTNIEVDKLISPIIKKYSWSFIDSKTKLIYTPVEEKVLTDANWSAIMIEQIINNALKYAKGKTIEIYFDNNTLYIKDTGVGIGSEDLPKIFNKGYSGFYGTANQKSSGLGLFIVRNISKRLNQKVSIESELGKGTVFSIEFNKTELAGF